MKRLLFLLSVLLFAACGEQNQLDYYSSDSQIYGLASVVQLSEQVTEVVLGDYFAQPNLIDSIVLPNGLNGNFAHDFSIATLTVDEILPPLAEMKVWIDGNCYLLLVRKSRKQPVKFSYVPVGEQPKNVQLAGQINDWNPATTPLEQNGDKWSTTLWLNPGSYHYQVVVDNVWMLDPQNPDKEDNNIGGMNSVVRVSGGDTQSLPAIYAKSASKGKVVLELDNEVKELFVFWENHRLNDRFVTIEADKAIITIPSNAKGMERSHLRVWAYNAHGESNDLLIPLSGRNAVVSTDELTRSDMHSQIIYSLMVDRFYNANSDNDFPVDDPEIHPKANYFGGDIAGIQQKIADGYFDSLGIRTIWMSPITQNPLGAYGLYPNPRTTFSGYHGYWPISSSKVDFRFGTEEELHDMLETAHNHNINVILDYVANHVHQEHPLYQNNPQWATPLYLPDGTMNTEKWDEHRLTTWFDTFMPTLDLEREEVYEPMTDSALFWLTEYAFDGFRHDATKHIPEVFWRTLTRKIKENVEPHRAIYQIGETYGSHELISGYIGSGMLNGQFDFNVYDAAVATFGKSDVPFEYLNGKLLEGFSYYGWHNLMGIITGNHDKGRFISYAGGELSFDEDAKLAGWTRTIGVGDTIGYNRLQLFNAFVLTIPGIPTIYQGDEFGQPGGNDPDNRRMMQFDNLQPREQQTLAITQKLASLRRTNLALNYGTFEPLLIDNRVYAFARSYLDNMVIVAFNNSNTEQKIELVLPQRLSKISYVNHFNSKVLVENETITIMLQPYSFDVLTDK